MTLQSKLAYLAGFMDGEGSFSIVKTYQVVKAVDGTKTKRVRYHLHIKIANTNLPVLRWIVDFVGGTVYEKKNCNNKWKTRYDWSLDKSRDVEVFILGILPYLRIKREQAKVALDFVRLYGQAVPEKRDELRHKMLMLNNSSQPHSESLTTNTQDTGLPPVKIESELHGDMQSDPVVTQEAAALNPQQS